MTEMKEKKMRNNNDGCLPFFIIGVGAIIALIGIAIFKYLTDDSSLLVDLLLRL